MKVNKTFAIDEELIDNLKKCNASQLICSLLNQHFKIKEDPLQIEKQIQAIDQEKETLIEFQDPANRGIITFYLSKGTHRVDLTFKNTKLRNFANFISMFSALLFIPLIIFGLKRKYV